MTLLQTPLKRTFSALAISLPGIVGLPFPKARGINERIENCSVAAFEKNLARLSRSGDFGVGLFSSFQAPEPPLSKGLNVFNDIDVSVSLQHSVRNSDPHAVFVVTGSSRGIGFQFVRKLLNETKGRIVACCRSPEDAQNLHELISTIEKESQERIELVQLDVENQDSIERASELIKSKFNRIDLLLNVAGILGDGKNTPGPERSALKMDREWMEKSFQVNVIGPMMWTKELAPLMATKRRPKKKEPDDSDAENNRAPAIIVNLSARVGSISDNGLGGWYSYRMSKAALNQATRTLANELKRQSVWCISLHPGTTDTDLSKPFQRNVQEGRLFPVEFTVDRLMDVINSMEEENSGGLYDWAGKAIPF